MGPDRVGLVSLYEEGIRTQTHRRKTTRRCGERTAVYMPRREAWEGAKPADHRGLQLLASRTLRKTRLLFGSMPDPWLHTAPPMSMRGVQHPWVVAEGAQQCVKGASGLHIGHLHCFPHCCR